MAFHVKLLSKYVLALAHKKLFPEIPRRNSFAKHSCECCVLWLKGKCSLSFPEPAQNLYFAGECNIFIETPMIEPLQRLQALVSDSGLFKAGREHEREHVKALIRVRMDQLHHNSIAWQECRNLYNIIK
jgi:hypothetical protein